MSIRFLLGTVAIVGLVLVSAAAQPQLNAGTVTATIDGAPFSANVSVATLSDRKLVLTNLSNLVQIQVPNAKVGKFPIKLDEDGGLVDVIVGLKVGNRYISPVSGSLTIEVLNSSTASGQFEFDGKDLGTDKPVKVTGKFQAKLIAKL